MQNVDKLNQNKPAIAFMTLGCKVNYYETEKMIEKFNALGFEIVPFSEYADVYVVNTCTVTNVADRKSRKMLHRAKKNNPQSFIVAVGCYAHAAKEELEKEENIDLVLGNDTKEQIVEFVIHRLKQEYIEYVQNFTQIEEAEPTAKKHIQDRTRA